MCFLLSFLIVVSLTPFLIHWAHKYSLFDKPDERKIHNENIPRLGGVALFVAFLISGIVSLILSQESSFHDFRYFFFVIIIFFIGLKDDFSPVDTKKKFFVLIAVISCSIWWLGFSLTSFKGVFNLFELNTFFSFCFSLFVILLFVNAHNFIDGSDGLLTSISFLSSASLALIFGLNGQFLQCIHLASLSAALFGFMIYNRPNAKIFMGDGGSLSLGYIFAIYSIQFINIPESSQLSWLGDPAIILALFVVPLIDTLQVFMKRVQSKQSPFTPDRNHLHHLLGDMGFSKWGIILSLLSWTCFMIGLTFSLKLISFRSDIIILINLGLDLMMVKFLRKRACFASSKVID